jgi:hypothetical protein
LRSRRHGGRFCGETDDSMHVWIRRFERAAQRVAQDAAVYDASWWQENIAPIWQDSHRREAIVVTWVQGGTLAGCGAEPRCLPI